MISAESVETEPWSRQRWFWTVGGLFALQLLLVIFLSDHAIRTPEWPVRQNPIRAVPESVDRGNFRERISTTDPTIFALVHPKNFSGSAWLRPPQFPYTPTNRIQPPSFLSTRAADLGNEFSEFVATAFPRFLPRADKPTPQIFLDAPQAPLTVDRAELRIVGGLKNRRLVFNPPLPAPAPGVLLANCVIEILVDAHGETFSPVMQQSSGSPAVDQEVLNFVAAARFVPLPKKEPNRSDLQSLFTHGTLVFQWFANRTGTQQLAPDP